MYPCHSTYVSYAYKKDFFRRICIRDLNPRNLSIIYYIYFIQIPMCQYIVINTSLRLDQLRVTALVQTVA